MFIRRKTVNGRDYYQVIETYRDTGRVRHRTIVSLGRDAKPEEAIYTIRGRMRHWRRQLNAWSHTRYLGGRAERRCVDIERRLGKAETELAKLRDVATRLAIPKWPIRR